MVVRTAGVEIRLFGHASVIVEGAPLKIAKRATTLGMLAYLILRRAAPVSRSFLAFTLFPDEPEEAALAELRRYLYLLTKALPATGGEPWLVVDAETLRWNGDAACRVDVVDFERLAANPATRAEAVDLYAGDLLEDVYDDWVVAERERLRTLYLESLEELVRTHRASREFGRAIAFAQRLLATDPWREDILRALMASRYAAGDSAGALAECARFVKRLREEVGVSPMPETIAFRDAIVRNEPIPGDVRSAPADDRPEPRTSARPLPLVGRSIHLEMLRTKWARAARGGGGAILIRGEAGIGKTRVCAELARIVESEGGRVFVGATSAPELVPYQCIIEALRSALPLLIARPLTPLKAAALARVLPELSSQFPSLPDLAPLEPQRESARVLDALADAVTGLARPRPLLLVLEDLHWAGPATLEALGTIARLTANAFILVVATYRDEDVQPPSRLRALGTELRAEGHLTTIDLERLERRDIADVVAGMEGVGADAEALVDRLYAHTEGNPLFLSETLADALEGSDQSFEAFEGVTSGIAQVVRTRLGRLGDDARAVAEIASVVGYGCGVELVREVAAFSPSAASGAFNELLDRRIMREASARSGLDYVFTHHLIAASIYESLDASTRGRRHARVAHIMERTSDEHSAVASDIARHYDRAGLGSDAARWYAEAARASAAVYASDEAIAFASRALELDPEGPQRAKLLQLRETLRGQRGDRDGQRSDLALLEAALEGCDDVTRFDLLRRGMLLARSLGETDEERTLLDEMSALSAASGDRRLQAETLRHRAAHAVSLSRQAEAREPATRALELFRELGDDAEQNACLGLLVDITANVGDQAAMRGYLEELRTRASTQGDRAVQAQALRVAATAALLNQRYRETLDLTREALPLLEALGDRDAEGLARGRLAVTSVWLEDFAAADAEFDRAIALLESTGNKRALSTTLTNCSLLWMRLGSFDRAEALIERSNALLPVVQEQRMAVANDSNRSFVRLQQGDAVGAETFARKALEGARAMGFPVFLAGALSNLGNALAAQGRFDEALGLMEEGLAIRRENQEPVDFADDLSDITLAYIKAGRIDDARATAEEIATIAEDSLAGAFWPHYALWAAAQGFRASGNVERAEALALRASAELARFAERITDESAREAFLDIRTSSAIATSAG